MADEEKDATPEEDDAREGVDLDDEVHYPPVANGLDYLVSVVWSTCRARRWGAGS